MDKEAKRMEKEAKQVVNIEFDQSTRSNTKDHTMHLEYNTPM